MPTRKADRIKDRARLKEKEKGAIFDGGNFDLIRILYEYSLVKRFINI